MTEGWSIASQVQATTNPVVANWIAEKLMKLTEYSVIFDTERTLDDDKMLELHRLILSLTLLLRKYLERYFPNYAPLLDAVDQYRIDPLEYARYHPHKIKAVFTIGSTGKTPIIKEFDSIEEFEKYYKEKRKYESYVLRELKVYIGEEYLRNIIYMIILPAVEIGLLAFPTKIKPQLFRSSGGEEQ